MGEDPEGYWANHWDVSLAKQYEAGYRLVHPSKRQLLDFLASHLDIDEIVFVGHGGAYGVVIHYGNDDKPVDRITPEEVYAARGNKKLHRAILEACFQCSKSPFAFPGRPGKNPPMGPRWQKIADEVYGYEGETTTAGRCMGFDWGICSSHIQRFDPKGPVTDPHPYKGFPYRKEHS